MARFDVFANPEPTERRATPYFLDVQNDHINGIATRVVVPLRRESVFGPRAARLHPIVEIRGEPLVLDTAALGAVPLSELRPPVANIRQHAAEVHNALDALFGAY